jgi:hypothetical protein
MASKTKDQLLTNKLIYFLWEPHLMTAVAFNEGWMPRFYRGWKPLPQKTNLIADKAVTSAISRLEETKLTLWYQTKFLYFSSIFPHS